MESKVLTAKQLDTALALAKAGTALDEALKIAKIQSDAKSALETANGWIALAVLLDPEVDEDTKIKVGFHHDSETG